MITTMKYRLKPTKTQVAVMYRTLDICRETHNLSLETKVDELKSRYTLLKYNTATGLAEIHACGDMNLCVNDTHVDASSVAEAGNPRL